MDTEVFIAGGGVGGLALAVKLASEGVHVTIAEQLKKVSPLYKGELLQPKTLAILEELDVLEEVLANGNKIEHLEFQEVIPHQDREPEEIGNTQLSYHRLAGDYDYALMVPHETIKRVLRDKGKEYDDYFHYLPSTRFLGFVDGEAALKQDGEERTLRAEVYVGAEGRSSPTRRQMEVDLKRKDYNHHFLTVTFPRPEDFTHGKIVTAKEKFLGLFPLPDNEVRTVLMIKAGTYKTMKEQGIERVHEAYELLEPRLAEHVRTIQNWKPIQLMIPYTYHVDHYVKDNMALIGDAAHTVHPMAGEGMNLAIQDAAVLGDLLTWCKQQGKNYSEYLPEYEKVRRPRVEFLLKLSHLSALVYSVQYSWWRDFRTKAVQKFYDDDKLYVKQMLNISGLGRWDFNLIDRAVQGGFLPTRSKRISDGEQLKKMFRKSDDYPWKYKEGGH
ncbi:FAD-dependent oxidoreductase [Thalassobacillus hwangdonensis]|uniref:FAD-dependent oxidoreductase n=1 Tax=Thalassobacillus hwangdonensis TaxID=546108 RepID=A0ABW3L2C4_9BACI